MGSQNAKGVPLRRRQQSTLKLNRPALLLLQDWAAELSRVRILDPACGSGNFLYVALKRLLDLWHEARVFGITHGLALSLDPIPHPAQLFGIEIDFYAHEIASIVVWIGFLQWKHDHAIKDEKEPLLQKLTNIEHADAILRYDADAQPYEPTWPQADYIIGNPPFLGDKLLRRELGDKYIDDLFDLYRSRVKAESDLVVYWFEKARRQLEANHVGRIGLLATQGIRGGANRAVLERIAETGTIFWAWSDRQWLLEGATVHVSMIGFDGSATTTPPMSFQGLSLAASDESEESPMRAPTARHITAQAEGLGPGAPKDQGLKARHMAAITTQDDVISTDASPGAPHLDPEMWDGAPGAPSMTASSSWVGPPQNPASSHPEYLPYLLDGHPVPFINPDLTTGSNTGTAFRLKENVGICFMGTTKVGPFDIDAETARKMLAAPLNPNGRPNSDVVRPWVNALDITRRPRNMYIIDFGTDTTEQQAALYEMPFEYIKHHVQPVRSTNERETYKTRWWIHGEARGELRKAIQPLTRYIATPRHSRHRLFIWLPKTTVPDSANFAFAQGDDYFIGILHSMAHELWARAQGTQVREVESGFRYTPNSTFDTFPFPWPPGTEPTEADSPIVHRIAEAARNLVHLRDNWLNPKDAHGQPLPEADLKDRTLTKLYNQRAAGKATWLANAHQALDEAVFAAYGWPPTLTRDDLLGRLLASTTSAPPPNPHLLKRRRGEVKYTSV